VVFIDQVVVGGPPNLEGTAGVAARRGTLRHIAAHCAAACRPRCGTLRHTHYTGVPLCAAGMCRGGPLKGRLSPSYGLGITRYNRST
jgi:hypothetical protein